MSNYILIKKESRDRTGKLLTADAAVDQLLAWGGWPLWSFTKCRKAIAAGDRLCAYVTGFSPNPYHVIAEACVAEISPWNASDERTYPLVKDGLPHVVIRLARPRKFKTPRPVRNHLSALSFIPDNQRKWGVSFMGGVRKVSDADLDLLLSRPNVHVKSPSHLSPIQFAFLSGLDQPPTKGGPGGDGKADCRSYRTIDRRGLFKLERLGLIEAQHAGYCLTDAGRYHLLCSDAPKAVASMPQ